MPNCSITFTATDSLVSGINSGDEVVLNVTLTSLDLSAKTNKVTNTTKSGRKSSSKFYTEEIYSLNITDEGTVTLPSTATTALTTEYMTMFFRSVDNSQPFFFTDLDNADASVLVQLEGDEGQRSRRSASYVNRFDYSFKIRKVI